MDDRIKKGVVGVALLAAFALGGAAVAGAVQGGNSAAAATATTTQGQAPPTVVATELSGDRASSRVTLGVERAS